MYYYLYKIVDTKYNAEYIGAHQTLDLNDGYMGSGLIIQNIIKKHGINRLQKEILSFFNSKEELYAAEKEIVNEEYINRKDTYNKMIGGISGPNQTGKKHYTNGTKNRLLNDYDDIPEGYYLGCTTNYLVENKQKAGRKASLNTLFINNGIDNKRINKNLPIPEGWNKGRIINYTMDYSVISASNRNSFWVTNGLKNKKIKHGENIPKGFKRGKTQKVKNN